jgi:hypothetical protein
LPDAKLKHVFLHDLSLINEVIQRDFGEDKLSLTLYSDGMLSLSGSYSSEKKLAEIKAYLGDSIDPQFLKIGDIESLANK